MSTESRVSPHSYSRLLHSRLHARTVLAVNHSPHALQQLGRSLRHRCLKHQVPPSAAGGAIRCPKVMLLLLLLLHFTYDHAPT